MLVIGLKVGHRDGIDIPKGKESHCVIENGERVFHCLCVTREEFTMKGRNV